MLLQVVARLPQIELFLKVFEHRVMRVFIILLGCKIVQKSEHFFHVHTKAIRNPPLFWSIHRQTMTFFIVHTVGKIVQKSGSFKISGLKIPNFELHELPPKRPKTKPQTWVVPSLSTNVIELVIETSEKVCKKKSTFTFHVHLSM